MSKIKNYFVEKAKAKKERKERFIKEQNELAKKFKIGDKIVYRKEDNFIPVYCYSYRIFRKELDFCFTIENIEYRAHSGPGDSVRQYCVSLEEFPGYYVPLKNFEKATKEQVEVTKKMLKEFYSEIKYNWHTIENPYKEFTIWLERTCYIEHNYKKERDQFLKSLE